MIALVAIAIHDERRIVLVSLGDRIMKQLQSLSSKMIRRKRLVVQVVKRLLPARLLRAVLD